MTRARTLDQDSINELRQLGGPFIARIQRREKTGKLYQIAYWENITLNELTGNFEANIFSHAGGGEYLISVYTPEDRTKPKHTFGMNIPGESKIPEPFQTDFSQIVTGGYTPSTGFGMPGPIPGALPNAIPGAGMYSGFGWPGFGFPGMPMSQAPASPAVSPFADAAKHQLYMDSVHQQRRIQRQEEYEDEERRERMRLEKQRAQREDDRRDDDLRIRRHSPVGVAGESEETRLLKIQIEQLREESKRREEAMRESTLKAEIARVAQQTEERFSTLLEEVRKSKTEDRSLEYQRREDARRAEEQRREDLRREEEQRKEEARREEDRRRYDAEGLRLQREREERREEMRLAEEARREERSERQRRWETEMAQRNQEFQRLVMEASKKDDGGMMSALTGIFGQTLQGQQQGSETMMKAMAAMMENARRSGELPEWMAGLLTNIVGNKDSKSAEMQAITQSASQLMSVAFGTMGQSIQQMAMMAGQGESPWVRLAEQFFGQIGAIGEALVSKSLTNGGTPKQLPQGETLEATQFHGTPAGVEKHEVIPEDDAPVGEAEPASSAQMLATRIRQIKKAIRTQGLKARVAAKALVETVTNEVAYSGDLPEPLDRLHEEPRAVLDELFGDFLRQWGETGDHYLATMVEWVETYLEGPEDAEGDEDSEDSEDSEEDVDLAGDEDEGSVATPSNGKPVVIDAEIERSPVKEPTARVTTKKTKNPDSEPVPDPAG